MKKYLKSVYIFFTSIALCACSPIVNQDSITNTFEEANKLYNQSEYQLSIDKYLEIVDTGYHSSELYFNLGNCYYKINQVANSILYYERALKLNPSCIGINNRDLKSLEISLNVFKELSKYIPKEIIKICESGLSRNDQLWDMKKYNADAFLIGEFLMKQSNILHATKSLIKK